MRHLIGILLALVLALSGCKTSVDLTVKNVSDDVPMGFQVRVLNRNDMEVRSIGLGDIAPGSAATQNFQVKNGSAFRVTGDVAGTTVVYRSSDFTIDGSENPFVTTIEAKPVGRIVDDNLSHEIISNSFKNIGADIGAQPLGLKDAFDTAIGALVVAIPGTENTIGKQLYTVSPALLGVKVMSLDDMRFPPTNESNETLTSGKAAAEISGSYGPFARFGFTWSQESVYKMKWVMRGYGQVNKIEDPGKSPATLFSRLPEEEISQINSSLQRNPGSKLYYINRFYVLERAELFINEGQRVTGSGQLDVIEAITASAAYAFDRSAEMNRSYGPAVLNYEGMELVPLQIRQPAVRGGNDKDIAILVPTGQFRLFRVDQL